MAKKPETRRRCECGATRFQGPNYRGEIINDELVPTETLVQCMGCNRVWPLEQLPTINAPEVLLESED